MGRKTNQFRLNRDVFMKIWEKLSNYDTKKDTLRNTELKTALTMDVSNHGCFVICLLLNIPTPNVENK